MRGMDDRAAANQRGIDALYQARLKAVTDCKGRVEPRASFADRLYAAPDELEQVQGWDRLNVSYLFAEWPPSMLS